MKIIAISDTHGQHHQLTLPEGDMIIHAGDITRSGKESQVKEFLLWFSKQPHRYKVFVAGNHDWYFEREEASIIKELIPEGIIYLNDEGIEIEGVKIWGSPIQPWFLDWAFNRQRGEDIQKHWDLIPEDSDIVVTHGPVYGYQDLTVRNEKVGCEDLLKTIQKIKPKYHISGHIHEGYGQSSDGITEYVNASVLNESYQLVNEPICFDY